MEGRYVIALDQGTTSSRAILVDRAGSMVDCVQRSYPQIYPQPGWVEHNPQEILYSQLGALNELVVRHGLVTGDVAAIGIDNQRETTIVWDPTTGEPIANAIVWQCRRTAALVEELCGGEDVRCMVQRKTGLLPDAYFSASKIRWLLDSVAGARERAQAGELLFGTVDSWLVWVLTGGLVHATDATNASRTMLYNIHEGRWDQELLRLFDIPMQMMPEVRPSAAYFGETSYPGVPAGIPICGVAGDQQAALFGQCCFEPGQAKNTYGTGCFLLMHTGAEAALSHNNLVTTVVATPPGCDRTEYALEGSVFVAGALVQWLRDELHLIRNAEDSEFLARGVDDTGGVYIVPAFTGLGAPWWQPDARGLICGITRGTTTAHLVRAALEALAYQTVDLVRAMEADAGVSLATLNVDGGASRNDFLMQFQADVLRSEIRRPKSVETTALGAAYLAGLTSGFWAGTDELSALRATDDVYVPHMDEGRARALLAGWADAVRRTT
ncbi:glycerol kinase [Olsenella uli DSM 7084]|uniref:Glycerol kinase n=1 Tax=Olsenella uli (strain ATCC 49627 / DSM 7084 / CCUG 31166 / CIP 109912 / JCM 12494 / LMG 11480 / NCIMB 702895 / VPI D76D-27C) TaxID=633147 RepID=E1QZ19_OLSUV|nr:glycerol kinase GlpK [Olsenella uli]ADK67633.1 glycerol kinase [Olsenella uli DSM 7084]KRO13576.1 glycerol kinase [Olsenella uli DSM 7084]